MGAQEKDDELPRDLYAFVTYLNVRTNRDLLETMEREELSRGQLVLLDRLRSRQLKPSIKGAARLIGRTPGGTSRMVDELARRGLVRREGDEQDPRMKRITITDRGDRVIARLHAARYERIVWLTDRLDGDLRESLRSFLEDLIRSEGEITRFRPNWTPEDADE